MRGSYVDVTWLHLLTLILAVLAVFGLGILLGWTVRRVGEETER